MLFNDRRMSANDRALKAALGPSLAPKGYKPDTLSRKNVKKFASEDINASMGQAWRSKDSSSVMSTKEAYGRGAETHEYYEKNPTELAARNRHELEKNHWPTKIDIPKNKRKGK